MTNPTAPQKTTAIRRRFEGVVLAAQAEKTIRVLVKTMKMHPKYKKQYGAKKTYAVHDEKRVAKVGDTVVFEECRPISKTKAWRLVSVKS